MTHHQSGIITDKLSLVVLSTIGVLYPIGKAYKSKIKAFVRRNYAGLSVDTIGDRLINLVEQGRIESVLMYPDHLRSPRMMYKLNIPEGMSFYGPAHVEYPDEPSDWSMGPVYCINGDILTPHLPSKGGWSHTAIPDKNIIGYYSILED